MIYDAKKIEFNGDKRNIVTQNRSGPCALLAIANVLSLSKKIDLPSYCISADELEEKLRNVLKECRPTYSSKESKAVFDHNLKDALHALPKLWEGLDINIKFFGIQEFEFTPECAVFDLLNISVYHGWLIDPKQNELHEIIGKLSYNQLEEKAICLLNSDDPQEIQKGILARDFLSGHQLSEIGIQELLRKLIEGQLAVFFHNNHFSTIYKREGNLFLLVTDNGFLHTKCIWEKLTSVDGNNIFYDDQFQVYQESDWQPDSYEPRPLSASSQKERMSSAAVAPSRFSSNPVQQETALASTANDEALAEQLQIEMSLSDSKPEESSIRPSRTYDDSFPLRSSYHSSPRSPKFDYYSRGNHVERRCDPTSSNTFTGPGWTSTYGTSDCRHTDRPYPQGSSLDGYYGHRTTGSSSSSSSRYSPSYHYRDPVPPYAYDGITPRSSLYPRDPVSYPSTHYTSPPSSYSYGSSGHSSSYASSHTPRSTSGYRSERPYY